MDLYKNKHMLTFFLLLVEATERALEGIRTAATASTSFCRNPSSSTARAALCL